MGHFIAMVATAIVIAVGFSLYTEVLQWPTDKPGLFFSGMFCGGILAVLHRAWEDSRP